MTRKEIVEKLINSGFFLTKGNQEENGKIEMVLSYNRYSKITAYLDYEGYKHLSFIGNKNRTLTGYVNFEHVDKYLCIMNFVLSKNHFSLPDYLSNEN